MYIGGRIWPLRSKVIKKTYDLIKNIDKKSDEDASYVQLAYEVKFDLGGEGSFFEKVEQFDLGGQRSFWQKSCALDRKSFI